MNFSDGHTATYDLDDESGMRLWSEIASNPVRSSQITGMAIHMHGMLLTLPRPKTGGFAFGARLLEARNGKGVSGERIYCDSRDTRVEVVCYASERLATVSSRPRWVRRFNPHGILDKGREK